MGVRGINLMDGDEVVGMQLNSQGYYLLVVSENGMGKRAHPSVNSPARTEAARV